MFKKQISKEEWEKNKKESGEIADKYDKHEETIDPEDAKLDHEKLSQSLKYPKAKKKHLERKDDSNFKDKSTDDKDKKNPLSKSTGSIFEHPHIEGLRESAPPEREKESSNVVKRFRK